MGVKGLWRLLLPIGRRISIEVLEGKIIAIDASIWLTQFLKAMRDPDTGSVKPAAHLIGFFRRLAKLRFHGIRPVLVFDGATPIIKLRELAQRRQRREQFAPTTDGAVLRLAKRLLIQEIKKSKQLQKSSKEGVQVDGFNLPSDDGPAREPANMQLCHSDSDVMVMKVEAQLEETSEEVARTLQEQEWQLEDRVDVSEGGGIVETSEEIALALQAEEWQEAEENTEKTPPPNDWDLPIQGVDSDDSSSARPVEHVGPFRAREGPIDVEYLTSLPACARKDVIEDALRKQRINSRKEFMPVAGQPAEYSKVQLRNFLRSTQLNKSIVKMGQQTAMLDNAEGERIASDPTRRMIFEKFDKKASLASSVALVQQGLKNGSDSEMDWDTGSDHDDHKSNHITPKKVRKRKRVIMDSSDEDDTPNTHVNPITGVACLDRRGAELSSLCVHSSDSDSNDGGFLRVTPTKSDDQLGRGASSEQYSGYCSSHLLAEDKPEPKSNSHCADREGESTLASTAPEETFASDRQDTELDSVDWEDGDAVSKSDDESDRGSETVEIPSERPRRTLAMDEDHLDSAHDKEIGTQNLAALHQAQSTAAKLTDWAARAFRRAIMQHEQDGVMKESSLGIASTPSGIDRVSARPSDAFPTQAAESAFAFDQGDQIVVSTSGAAGGAEALETYRTEKGESMAPVNDVEVRGGVAGIVNESMPSVGGHQQNLVNVVDLSNVGSLTTDPGGEGYSQASGNGARRDNAHPIFSTDAAEELLAEEQHLDAERRRHARDMETIDDEMKSEIISLIELFGIPYIESPAEAEAQCVALEALGLVDGIVTEDSDVFVFGGKTIYRNMFDDQKFVEVYRAEDAMKEMSLGREQMVAMAMLLGGDYTEGVKGVGIVNAMEIIETFPMSPDVKEGLQKFRTWLDGFDSSDISAGSSSDPEGTSGLQKFHASHKAARLRWICPKHFPAENVLNAYLNPVVDNSSQRFSWGLPDVDQLVKFCTRNMGWEASETRRMLDPIGKRLEGGMRQTRLDTFMRYSDNIQFANVRSKRLRTVFEGVQKEAS